MVTFDRYFERLVSRMPRGNYSKFRRLGRISFKCDETKARQQVERWIELIEFHYQHCRRRPDFRMIAIVHDNGLKLL